MSQDGNTFAGPAHQTTQHAANVVQINPQKRRLQLSDVNINLPIIGRSTSLYHDSPTASLDPKPSQYKPGSRRTASLFYDSQLETTRSRRRHFSAQSENERPVSRHERAPPTAAENRNRQDYAIANYRNRQRRLASNVFDGPSESIPKAESGPSNVHQFTDPRSRPDFVVGQSTTLSISGHEVDEVPGSGPECTETESNSLTESIEDPVDGGTITGGKHLHDWVKRTEAARRGETPERDSVSRSHAFVPIRASSDRFVHPRRPELVLRNSFLTSRPASGLTQQQRMHRRRTGFTDPLGPLRRPVSGRSDQNQGPPGSRRPAGAVQATTQIALRSEFDMNLHTTNRLLMPQGRVPSTSGAYRPRTPAGHEVDSRRQLIVSASNARYHPPKFLEKRLPAENRDLYEKRLALALDLDLSTRVLDHREPISPSVRSSLVSNQTAPSSPFSRQTRLAMPEGPSDTFWSNNGWQRRGAIAFLEAEGLRDDYYCSVLAYSYRADFLAVGLGSRMYLWNEGRGLIHPPQQLEVQPPIHRPAYITSLAFSSEAGGQAILAIGRVDGRLMLWSPLDAESRFMPLTMPHSASHLSFRPQTIRRRSQRHESVMADNEVLLVGDDYGNIWVFLVEWPKEQDRFLYGWDGGLALIAKIDVHAQQICGIAWSSDGDFFATGGNDNLCCMFQANVLFGSMPDEVASTMAIRRDAAGNQLVSLGPTGMPHTLLDTQHVRHCWRLSAAVKALAFCPWQRGLLAAGGGSNDRCVHFYHTMSGACLETIDCAAQVTSLVWSTTRREIAATLGFPQPEHAYRIVVYAWPSCEQVAAIPWHDEMRALYAIPYPGGPDGRRRAEQGTEPSWTRRTSDECIIVAGSDSSIKFHEIWSPDQKAMRSGKGLLGGSDILESLHGIEKDFGETIR